MPESDTPHVKARHSRAGGNPYLRVTLLTSKSVIPAQAGIHAWKVTLLTSKSVIPAQAGIQA